MSDNNQTKQPILLMDISSLYIQAKNFSNLFFKDNEKPIIKKNNKYSDINNFNEKIDFLERKIQSIKTKIFIESKNKNKNKNNIKLLNELNSNLSNEEGNLIKIKEAQLKKEKKNGGGEDEDQQDEDPQDEDPQNEDQQNKNKSVEDPSNENIKTIIENKYNNINITETDKYPGNILTGYNE